MAERKNINEATREEVAALPFMNESRAEMIVHYREVNGPYKKQSDIEKVTGINKALAARVAEYFEISELEAGDEGDEEDDDRDSKRRAAVDRELDEGIKKDQEEGEAKSRRRSPAR